jgi:methyl-accepting chemotaxis protein
MHLSISKKILGGFLVILILLAIGTGISINRISYTDESFKQLIMENVENAMLAKDLDILYLNQTREINNYLLTGDESYLSQYEDTLKEANETIKLMQEAFVTPEEKETVNQLAAFQLRYDEIVRKAIAFKKAGNEIGYINLLNTSGKTVTNVFQAKIVALDKIQEKIVFSGIESLGVAVKNTKLLVLLIGLVSFIIGIALALIISRTISKPISQASEAIQKVAQGDLQIEPLQIKTKDEVGELAHSFNIMVHDLREVVGKVYESSSSVAASSQELAASAEQSTSASEQVSRMTQSSAEGNEQQESQFKELMIAINSLNTDIQNVADNSKEMLQLTENTSGLTQKGEAFIDHVVGQMNLIQQSVVKASNSIYSLRDRSNEISQITKIITDVAEQTNLLALNAAIEAARAGEHGKGFAVVADEVRKLAEESKRSASQITTMINHIQTETNESVQMMSEENQQVVLGLEETEEANKAFKEISQAMTEVSSKVKDVTTSLQQMLAVSDKIMEAVITAKQITEKNAENSQESAAATEEQYAALEEIASASQFLAQMAEDLITIISKFKLDNKERGS